MGQCYPYQTIWQTNILIFYHIYGARDILLLLYENQDTETDSQNIEMDEAGRYQSLYSANISILYNSGEKYCVNSSYVWN